MPNHQVGGEVDALCTRCKLNLAHTILAMVGTKIARVRCNTCGGDHTYRPSGGTIAARPRAQASHSARAEPSERVTVGFAQRVAAKDPGSAKKYSVRQLFVVEDLIEHPTFGLGIVSAVRGDKIDVAFKAAEKTLVHGKGEGTAHSKPSFAPPSTGARAPAGEGGLDDNGG